MGNTHPRLYALLGDKLFEANLQFESFKSIDVMSQKIETYQSESKRILKQGHLYESDGIVTIAEKQHYLKSLRSLEQQYSGVIHSLEQELSESIQFNQYEKFAKIINAGLDDVLENRLIQDKVIAFYQQNKSKGKLVPVEGLIKEREQKAVDRDQMQQAPEAYLEQKSSQSRSRYTIELTANRDAQGNDYAMKTPSTLEACKKQCLDEQQCKGFTFNPKYEKCWLKSAIGPSSHHQLAILGIKKEL